MNHHFRIFLSKVPLLAAMLPFAASASDESPQNLRQRLLNAISLNDMSAAQSLLCADGAVAEIRDLYLRAFASDVGQKVQSATIENSKPLQPGESYIVPPEGLLRLKFGKVNQKGEQNFKSEAFYYFGRVNGKYCFLVPLS